MRWITEQSEFREIFLQARTAVYIDSAREETELKKLEFDDAETGTKEFFTLLKWLMRRSGDEYCFYVVLDPDPVHYFHRLFGKYPAVEFSDNDTEQEYLAALDEPHGNNRADAVGINCWAWTLVCPSMKWFVHALRSSDQTSGHLWIQDSWIEPLKETYPWAHPSKRNS